MREATSSSSRTASGQDVILDFDLLNDLIRLDDGQSIVGSRVTDADRDGLDLVFDLSGKNGDAARRPVPRGCRDREGERLGRRLAAPAAFRDAVRRRRASLEPARRAFVALTT